MQMQNKQCLHHLESEIKRCVQYKELERRLVRDGDWFLVTGHPTFGGGLASESGQLSHREVIAGLGEKWIIDIFV